MKRSLVLVAVALLAACSNSHSSTQSTQSTSQVTPGPAGTNSTDFPLIDGSTVIASRDFTQSVNRSAASGEKGVFSQGSGTYSGHQVIADTPATMPQLRAWLDGLDKTPPAGYSVAATGSAMQEARSRANAYGIDFDVFQKPVNGKKHGLVVVAIDPAILQAKAGPMLSFVAKYKMLPQAFRDPIDAQAKSRTGYSITEALNPNTPLGAALGALDQLKASGERGVVLVDATKQ